MVNLPKLCYEDVHQNDRASRCDRRGGVCARGKATRVGSENVCQAADEQTRHVSAQTQSRAIEERSRLHSARSATTAARHAQCAHAHLRRVATRARPSAADPLQPPGAMESICLEPLLEYLHHLLATIFGRVVRDINTGRFHFHCNSPTHTNQVLIHRNVQTPQTQDWRSQNDKTKQKNQNKKKEQGNRNK